MRIGLLLCVCVFKVKITYCNLTNFRGGVGGGGLVLIQQLLYVHGEPAPYSDERCTKCTLDLFLGILFEIQCTVCKRNVNRI